MLNKIKTWSEYIIPYKTEVATDVTDFDNEQKCYCILTLLGISSYDQMCILRDKKVYYYHSYYEATQTGFLILKQYQLIRTCRN